MVNIKRLMNNRFDSMLNCKRIDKFGLIYVPSCRDRFFLHTLLEKKYPSIRKISCFDINYYKYQKYYIKCIKCKIDIELEPDYDTDDESVITYGYDYIGTCKKCKNYISNETSYNLRKKTLNNSILICYTGKDQSILHKLDIGEYAIKFYNKSELPIII